MGVLDDDSPWEAKESPLELVQVTEAAMPRISQRMVAGALTPTHIGQRFSMYDDKGDYYQGELESFSITKSWKGVIQIRMTLVDKKSHHYLDGVGVDDLMEVLP